jgi:hypothetical protein
VEFVHTRLDPGAGVPTLAIKREQVAGDVVHARHRRQGAEAFGHRLPQVVFGQPQRSLEQQRLHGVARHENVPHGHAIRRSFGGDLNVVEAAESVQVIDRLPYVVHHERFADFRLNQPKDDPIGDGKPFLLGPDIHDGQPHERGCLRRPLARAGEERNEQKQKQKTMHQKTWRTRTSSA